MHLLSFKKSRNYFLGNPILSHNIKLSIYIINFMNLYNKIMNSKFLKIIKLLTIARYIYKENMQTF